MKNFGDITTDDPGTGFGGGAGSSPPNGFDFDKKCHKYEKLEITITLTTKDGKTTVDAGAIYLKGYKCATNNPFKDSKGDPLEKGQSTVTVNGMARDQGCDEGGSWDDPIQSFFEDGGKALAMSLGSAMAAVCTGDDGTATVTVSKTCYRGTFGKCKIGHGGPPDDSNGCPKGSLTTYGTQEWDSEEYPHSSWTPNLDADIDVMNLLSGEYDTKEICAIIGGLLLCIFPGIQADPPNFDIDDEVFAKLGDCINDTFDYLNIIRLVSICGWEKFTGWFGAGSSDSFKECLLKEIVDDLTTCVGCPIDF